MKLNLGLFGGGVETIFVRKTPRESFTGDLGFDNSKLAGAKAKFTEKDTEIKTLFATFKSSLDTAVGEGAFLGSTQVSALKTYVDDMSDAMMNFLAQFETFGAKLDDAAANYAAQVSAQASTFGSADTSVGAQ